MSFRYGPPTIVTDGLVFYMDAGNPRCYISGSSICTDVIFNAEGTIDNTINFNPTNGGYWEFDGSDSDIALGAQTAGQWSSDPCTFEFVVRKTTLSSGILFMDRTDWKGTDGVEMFFYYYGGNLTFESRAAGNGSSSPAVASSPLSIDVWYHLVGVCDGTDGKVYVNGEEDGTDTILPINNSTGNSYIGVYGNGSSTNFGGDLGLMRIYHKALTAAEVLQNYNANKERFGL